MQTKRLTWGDALSQVLSLGVKAADSVTRHTNARRQIRENVILLEPVHTEDQPIPEGWLVVGVPEGGIFRDAWGAAQAISAKARHCTYDGVLSETQGEGGMVLIPKADGQALWSKVPSVNQLTKSVSLIRSSG